MIFITQNLLKLRYYSYRSDYEIIYIDLSDIWSQLDKFKYVSPWAF